MLSLKRRAQRLSPLGRGIGCVVEDDMGTLGSQTACDGCSNPREAPVTMASLPSSDRICVRLTRLVDEAL